MCDDPTVHPVVDPTTDPLLEEVKKDLNFGKILQVQEGTVSEKVPCDHIDVDSGIHAESLVNTEQVPCSQELNIMGKQVEISSNLQVDVDETVKSLKVVENGQGWVPGSDAALFLMTSLHF